MFDDKAVGVVIGTGRILKLAVSHQRTFRHITLTDNHLAGIRPGPVGVSGKVADHAVHPYHLIDVAGNETVIISFLSKIHIVMIGAFVRQLQGTVDIVLNGILLWRQPEKKLMEPSYMLPGFSRTVL